MDNGGPEAWQTMEIASLAKAAQYKIDRAMQPSTVLQKKLDDLEDAYNFIAAIYERVCWQNTQIVRCYIEMQNTQN